MINGTCHWQLYVTSPGSCGDAAEACDSAGCLRRRRCNTFRHVSSLGMYQGPTSLWRLVSKSCSPVPTSACTFFPCLICTDEIYFASYLNSFFFLSAADKHKYYNEIMLLGASSVTASWWIILTHLQRCFESLRNCRVSLNEIYFISVSELNSTFYEKIYFH